MKAMFVYGDPSNVRYALLKGPLREWLKGHRIPALWSSSSHGWWVRLDRLGDVIAQAERDGYRVRMKGATR